MIYEDINLSSNHFVPELIGDVGNAIAGTSGNIVGIGFLIAIAFITFVGSKSIGFEKSFAFSSFFGAVVSMLMVKLGWISSGILYIVIALFIISLFLLMKSDD